MRRILICGCVALLLAEICSARKKTPPPPDPKLLAIRNVSVLPIVDARADKKSGVNLDKLQGQIVNLLQHKHYPAGSAGSPGSSGEIAIEDVESAAPNFLKKLGPESERWVMVVFLNDLASKLTFGSTGNAQLSAYLFDKEGGELVWSGKGVGQAGQGGLIGMPMKGMMKGQALDAAASNLLASLQNRPKPGK